MPSHENTPHYEESDQEQLPESTGPTNEEVIETAPAPRWIIDENAHNLGPQTVIDSYRDANENEWVIYEDDQGHKHHTMRHEGYVEPDEKEAATINEQKVDTARADVERILNEGANGNVDVPEGTQEVQINIAPDIENENVDVSPENQTPTEPVVAESPSKAEKVGQIPIQSSLDAYEKEINRDISRLERAATQIEFTRQKLGELSRYLGGDRFPVGNFATAVQPQIDYFLTPLRGVLEEDNDEASFRLDSRLSQAGIDIRPRPDTVQHAEELGQRYERLRTLSLRETTIEDLRRQLNGILAIINESINDKRSNKAIHSSAVEELLRNLRAGQT